MRPAWRSAEAGEDDPLLCETVDIGGDILRLLARERHVHPGVRIKDGKRERFRVGRKLPCDYLEGRGVGNIPAQGRRHDMAGDAAHLGQTFAVLGVRRESR